MMTLKDYAERILEPSIQRLEAKKGKSREQILAENEALLEPHRKVMAGVSDGAAA